MGPSTVFLALLWVSGWCVSSAQSEVKELKCIVGERVTFATQVKESALIYKSSRGLIASVIGGNFEVTDVDFSGRLQWDSSTEFFYITGLNMEDSGEYRVEDRYQRKVFKYKLAVYNPVSRPQVYSRNKMNPTCSVLCSVQNGREVTLSWQREGETLNQTSSPDLSTLLSLPLEIEYNSAPYSCVVNNPGSNQTVTVKAEEYCFDPVSKPQVSSRNKMNPTCSVLCSVRNGREVTLSWQREGETLNHTSSPDLSTLLSLPLEIENNSAPYSCVVKNPVSNQMVTVKPEEYCFDPVSRPQVSSTKKKPTCSVLCSVQNGRGVTLSWQREGETLNDTSSPDLSTLLSLSLEIEYNSAPYSCVVKNPARSETVTVKREDYCSEYNPWPLVAGIGAGILVLLIIVMVIYIYLKRRSKTPGSQDPSDALTYASINHRTRETQREQNTETGQTGASNDLVYGNINHHRSRRQEAAARRANQEEACVYAEVKR